MNSETLTQRRILATPRGHQWHRIRPSEGGPCSGVSAFQLDLFKVFIVRRLPQSMPGTWPSSQAWHHSLTESDTSTSFGPPGLPLVLVSYPKPPHLSACLRPCSPPIHFARPGQRGPTGIPSIQYPHGVSPSGTRGELATSFRSLSTPGPRGPLRRRGLALWRRVTSKTPCLDLLDGLLSAQFRATPAASLWAGVCS